MKTNFTLVSKAVLFIFLTLAFSKSFSSNICPSDSPFINLTANVENNNLVINWSTLSDAAANGYCEIQASEDGKTFSTIGFVMGADPKLASNSFTFKQNLKKMKPGKVFYRVLNVTENNTVVASSIVKIAQ
jgi:hypothetical protein